jgi:hypothetical protein
MTSSTAQGVSAVKQCKFPPFSGYRTMVSDEESKASSVFTLAKRAPIQEEQMSCVKWQNIFEETKGAESRA